MAFFQPDGLRFSCTACGDCCGGEPGYVWVNDDEITALAGQMELTREVFLDTYVRVIGDRRSLNERADGDCVLLDPKTRKCTVYDARPTQCRTWPFWPDNVANEEAWAQTCDACPGAGTGELHSVEAIVARLAEQRRARRAG